MGEGVPQFEQHACGTGAPCTQQKLDHLCSLLGTNDKTKITGETAECNNKPYARHDGIKFRCYESLRTRVMIICFAQVFKDSPR